MSPYKFVKSFSQGQITIPKEFRNELNLGQEFWLKLILEQDKIIAEPAIPSPTPSDYSQKLLQVKGGWFDLKDWQKTRQQVSRRLNATP